ncbi:bidirectional sugar transporter SWEET10-like [Neltuma alba]|uniref:bidirectional sugar transporter SWEET10-like n=1 Tax=Neltuma alba TaxID=207710 RepID=UPI0010A2E362|nr:bidirectional sugar transporter SWEET10-like [Prosopis alba]
MALHQHQLAFIFGFLGNIISFMGFLATMPTFYRIYKNKSAEGFQSYPHVAALFSCMLWTYGALVKNNETLLLITINYSCGIVFEIIGLSIFLFCAPKKLRFATVNLLLLLNVFGFGAMLLSTLYLSHGNTRCQIIGWICLVADISVFGPHLLIIRKVIKTKSVEYMPFSLSMFLTAKAVTWFFYGLFLKEYYFIALPNTLGFLIGTAQIVLYLTYRNARPVVLEDPVKDQGLSSDHVIDVVNLGTMIPEDENNKEQRNPNSGEKV